MTARLYTTDPLDGFMPKSFGGHRDVVLRAFFSEDEKTVRRQRVGLTSLTADIYRVSGRSGVCVERQDGRGGGRLG